MATAMLSSAVCCPGSDENRRVFPLTLQGSVRGGFQRVLRDLDLYQLEPGSGFLRLSFCAWYKVLGNEWVIEKANSVQSLSLLLETIY